LEEKESAVNSAEDGHKAGAGDETRESKDAGSGEEAERSSERETEQKGSDASVEDDISRMAQAFGKKLSLGAGTSILGDDLSIESVARAIRSGKVNKVVVLSGAGISVAAGIPDFRSKGTGLYDNLQKYDLPYPEAIFELEFFEENPKPFCVLAKGLYPGSFDPTPAHYFVRLLHEKGMLLRNFTQNIDTLERRAGVPSQKLVEAHGSFADASCLRCHREHSVDYVREAIFNDDIPRCKFGACGGLVKPNIVFFGEGLPKRFWKLRERDMPRADLVIVMGTSLKVQPFCTLVDDVGPKCPRLLINRERVGVDHNPLLMLLQGVRARGLLLGTDANTRDVEWLGDIQDGVRELVRLIGWEEELNALMAEGKSKL